MVIDFRLLKPVYVVEKLINEGLRDFLREVFEVNMRLEDKIFVKLGLEYLC